jgi:thiosulfate/3-mercaptopyruvate sulfurtransferase
MSTPDPVLLDCRAGAWAAGHFEGALDADLNRFLSTASDPGFDPAVGGRHPLPPLERWLAQLGAWGIGPETPVVAYDGVHGEMGACRAWWMLKAVGHGPVDVLDGGIAAGKSAEWAWTAELDGAAAFAADPRKVLVDVRAAERWRGEVEALDPVAGRIPGSVNVFLGKNLGDGRFLAADRLRALYEPLVASAGVDAVAVHCGSGVSACATLYALDKAGLGRVALYVGSYSEWCRSGRPLGRGAE